MIKALYSCLAIIALCYLAFIGHYYYQTFSSFTHVEHTQQQ